MKPLFSGHHPQVLSRHHDENEELTPLIASRNAGKKHQLPAYSYNGPSHVTIADAAAATAAALQAASIKRPKSRRRQQPSTSTSPFVAKLYSDRDGSTYIRYQAQDHNQEAHKEQAPPFCYSQRQRRCCFLSWTWILVVVVFMGAGGALYHHSVARSSSIAASDATTTASTTITTTHTGNGLNQQYSNRYSRVPRCTHNMPCFEPGRIQVPSHQEGFPSYWNYAGPMNVTYDVRSMLINGDRVLFLGGAMHPERATSASWELALDEAVRNGLNLVTIDIFWSAHQPFWNSSFDWSMSPQQPDWELAHAIRSCASRGLFVHLRVGPYAADDYSFGGIPEWLPLQYPDMRMRRLDPDWQAAMEGFLRETIDYMMTSKLWAHQGGPIVMAQVESELGDDESIDMGDFGQAANSWTQASRQAYADWCGELVARLSPNGVVWTMSNNELAANNTISTYSNNGDRSTKSWLERHGDTGRIQVDQPALWTQDEGGSQLWGEHAAHPPTNTIWGKTAESMSNEALQWFARGGAYLNHDMWWGGYNRGRSAAASSLNAHAIDTVLCPSGERRQPKYAHFQALHTALAEIAPILLHARSALGESQSVEITNDDGNWETGQDQAMFVYRANHREAIFVENREDEPVVARVPCSVGVGGSTADNSNHAVMVVLEMEPRSTVLLIDGMVRHDSGAIRPRAMAFARRYIRQPVILLDWATWQEPVGIQAPSPLDSAATTAATSGVHVATRPLEQTALNMNDEVWSDYAWYQTTFTVENHLDNAVLRIDTQKANGIVAFLDGKYVDAADNHERGEGGVSLYLSLGSMKSGTHVLALLSESFGYSALIARSKKNTGAKLKGITGNVVLSSPSLRRNMNLVDGRREWLSFAGLHAERVPQESHGGVRGGSSVSMSSSRSHMTGVCREHLQKTLRVGWGAIPSTASWSAAYFDSPRYDPSTQGLYLRITSGRGHLWLNGRDLGRYWNITRAGDTGTADRYYSQEYYFLPNDYLHGDSGRLNEIVLFDVFGGDHRQSELVLSWTEAASDDEPSFLDQVDFREACLV